ncbi:Gfo/Idh/MocA family protein [Eupransor demetentiae]|uniref:Predicted dehydrogenase (MviM) n=1 Tax=Eupransor demetentiae TaxID=3109584 RepID=A0ABP0EQU4_9LACO|nr:Predicted dehydrogenase (MviM) [Lactobacillaceae bacterium LMG 33000]
MLRIGTIGTSWITKQLIQAVAASDDYRLDKVYSRSLDHAEDFIAELEADAQDAIAVDSLSDLLSELDIVYIASPNSLHFEQVLAAIRANINVIVEKPAFSNPAEYAKVQAVLAQHPDVHLFEAARHIHQPNFKLLVQQVERLPKVQGATFTMAQYSSKYDAYLAGKQPNVFEKKFSAGALYDLGVYPLYAALTLFGQPQAVQYLPIMLDNGADGSGSATLFYGDFNVTLHFSKTYNSNQVSEIYGERQTLTIDHVADVNKLTLSDGQGGVEDLSREQDANPMAAELSDFAKILANPTKYRDQYQYDLKLSMLVNQMLFDLRQSAGIDFPADADEK